MRTVPTIARGENITPETFRALSEAIRELQDLAGGPDPVPSHDGLVCVVNDSGYDIDRYGVLAVPDVLYAPDGTLGLEAFLRQPILKGSAPAADCDPFVVAQQPIPVGAAGWAMAVGVTPVQISVADAADTHADSSSDETTLLASGKAGPARILYKQSGTGTVWAVVCLGQGLPAGDTDYQCLVWSEADGPYWGPARAM
jgi:hypothetical protein